jgi:5-methylcytosine-specific restriction endonuclease McrA
MPSKTPKLRAIAEDLKTRRGPCILCGQPIDYTLPFVNPDGTRNPGAFTLEHIKPRSTHPHLVEDPTNCAPAHYSCNQRKGDREQDPDIGNTSRKW